MMLGRFFFPPRERPPKDWLRVRLRDGVDPSDWLRQLELLSGDSFAQELWDIVEDCTVVRCSPGTYGAFCETGSLLHQYLLYGRPGIEERIAALRAAIRLSKP
jgi:hypothetical protein